MPDETAILPLIDKQPDRIAGARIFLETQKLQRIEKSNRHFLAGVSFSGLGETGFRRLENGLLRIEKLLRRREPLYKAIANRIDTSAMTVEQQADAIERLYREQS